MILLVAVPVCHKDIDLVMRNLDTCEKRDGKVKHHAIVFYDNVLGDFSGQKVVEKARDCFDDVQFVRYDNRPGPSNWPIPQNYAWQIAARCLENLGNLKKQYAGWLWWEGDATPIKAGWLDKLCEAKLRSHAPFMGHIVADMGHMNGVGIYPFNISDYCTKALLTKNSSFDVVLSEELDKKCIARANDLIAHRLKRYGGEEPTEMDIVKVPATVVLYHGCNQGIKQIEGTGDVLPDDKPTLMQVLMAWRASSGKFTAQFAPPSFYTFSITTAKPTVWHVLERHKTTDEDAARRTNQAEQSWLHLYKERQIKPCHLWRYPRSSRSINDLRGLPFLKDVIAEGLTKCKEQDVVLLTNDDTIFHSQVMESVLKLLSATDAVSSFRVNFDKGQLPPLTMTAGEVCAGGKFDLGRDLFAMRASWLRNHWHSIPDFLLGEMEWDLVLAVLIRKLAGLATTKLNISEVLPKVEIPRGYVLHETHVRSWVSPEFKSSPSKAWNQKLCLNWYADNGFHALISAPTVTL